MHTALFPIKAGFTEEEISERAYVLWLKRGRPKGYESEIWREAKSELESESGIKTKRRRFFQRNKTGVSLAGFCRAMS
jgi:Protein of unknown function (DUF2934)